MGSRSQELRFGAGRASRFHCEDQQGNCTNSELFSSSAALSATSTQWSSQLTAGPKEISSQLQGRWNTAVGQKHPSTSELLVVLFVQIQFHHLLLLCLIFKKGSHFVGQAGLKLAVILLSQTANSWDDRHEWATYYTWLSEKGWFRKPSYFFGYPIFLKTTLNLV